jgi:hypothetical protein
VAECAVIDPVDCKRAPVKFQVNGLSKARAHRKSRSVTCIAAAILFRSPWFWRCLMAWDGAQRVKGGLAPRGLELQTTAFIA